MTLPKLSAQQRIALPDGRPSSPFLQFMEKARTDQTATDARQDATDAALQEAVDDIIALNARQDQTDLDLQAQIDRLTAILAGTGETFTGLSVGGTNVKVFLDKTDGAQLTDPTGLAGSVVETATLDSGAANQSITATAATVALTAGVQTTVLSLVVTTIAGEVVDLTAQFGYLEISSAALAPLMVGQWYRGITAIVPSAVARGLDITRAADPARYVLAEGSMTVVASDVPGAGTFTYDLVVESSVVSGAINPSARLLTTTRP